MSNPALTDDKKVFAPNGQLAIEGVNIEQSISSNGIERSVRVLNNSGVALLILTADGMRTVCGKGNQLHDGNCYFICKYIIGRDVEVDIGSMVNTGSMDPEQIAHISKEIEIQRRSHMSARPDARVVEIDFHYVLPCQDIGFHTDGIWLPFLGIHVFKSGKRDDERIHFGMEGYAEVIRLSADARERRTLANQSGVSVLYITHDPKAEEPIFSFNEYYQGILFPTYDTIKPPGVYITRYGRRTTLNLEPLKRHYYIPVDQLLENRIFTMRDSYAAYVKEALRHKSKDGEEVLKALIGMVDPDYIRSKTGNRILDYEIAGTFSLGEVFQAIGAVADVSSKGASMFSKKR